MANYPVTVYALHLSLEQPATSRTHDETPQKNVLCQANVTERRGTFSGHQVGRSLCIIDHLYHAYIIAIFLSFLYLSRRATFPLCVSFTWSLLP
jgi:hypothetical protein